MQTPSMSSLVDDVRLTLSSAIAAILETKRAIRSGTEQQGNAYLSRLVSSPDPAFVIVSIFEEQEDR